ncbi:hypothetical protein [Caldisericum exile]|uniref:Uncharacterized protein n=1 Tax=Caldisericum exile (strain DSM 21853 / NBRC 104410 / AZM16c01) TaxID=511051 RepID=A0A7U6GDJ5_CALEA|nr:hypothetical protein [Caldisericum exile]BAL80365.1 hypothetical protein CSE_02390 [Caldisericum exile AZM16c01]
MRWKIIIVFILLFAITSIGCVSKQENYTDKLKESCIEATITGIKLDIERLEGYLKLPDLKNRSEVEKALSKLYEDLRKYQNMNVKDYELPKPLKIRGYISEPYVVDSIIYLEKQSKSGPFYHAVKVMGDKENDIKPKEIYEFTIYPVYRRYYPFEAWYVLIESFEK